MYKYVDDGHSDGHVGGCHRKIALQVRMGGKGCGRDIHSLPIKISGIDYLNTRMCFG